MQGRATHARNGTLEHNKRNHWDAQLGCGALV